jgi:hypothetical protein
MRALCGAIITCGALIGIGLTAVGIGQRYAHDMSKDKDGNPFLLHVTQMDRPLLFCLVFLTCVAIVGLGIAFIGLAYHHHRREREHTLERDRAAAHHRTTV